MLYRHISWRVMNQRKDHERTIRSISPTPPRRSRAFLRGMAMLKILERNIESVHDRLVLLAPGPTIPKSLENVTTDSRQHTSFLRRLQRLRGRIYLNDGALRREQLSHDGRHETPEDSKSWHLLVLDDNDHVSGCIWYLEHEKPSFEGLRIRHAALANDPAWGHKLRSAVDGDVARAGKEKIHYAEVGGWAVAENSRLTDCLLLILSTYGLSQLLGGAFVVATATLRHSSAAVLRTNGGIASQRRQLRNSIVFRSELRLRDGAASIRHEATHPRDSRRMVELLKDRLATLPVFAHCGSMNEFDELETLVPPVVASNQRPAWQRVA